MLVIFPNVKFTDFVFRFGTAENNISGVEMLLVLAILTSWELLKFVPAKARSFVRPWRNVAL